jgi:ATP-dependent Clp protease ATP-binding subunit ClpC
MFDRYTLRALQSVAAARVLVSEYGSAMIDTEHLLLGILRVDADAIGRFLPSKTTDEIRAEVEQGMAVKPEIPKNIDIPPSTEAAQILTFASEEAHAPRHHRVDMAHLVAGMLREDKGVAGQILRSAGMSLEAVREHLSLGEADTE